MKILISAFSCSPNGGSEEAVGWNWSVAAAHRGHEVTVLTPDGQREAIEAAPVPDGLSFVFVPEPPMAEWVPGVPHWYVRYLRWQRAIVEPARRLVRERGIDVVHHLTWASVQLGTFLGALDAPLVFGPVGGGQTANPALRPFWAGRWATEMVRSVITDRLIRIDPLAVRTVRAAAVCVADNDDTAAMLHRLGARGVRLQTQCGVAADTITPPNPAHRDRDVLELLWVGRFMPRKGLPLALEAMRGVDPSVPVRLRIVGHGQLEDQVPGWIREAGLEDRVELVGRVPYADMPATYRRADALLFTSIRDSGGIQLVEAMGQGLPCIALRQHGARLLVPDGAGITVPVTDPDGTAAGLAGAITRMAMDRTLWWDLAQGAHRRANELTWEALVADFDEVLTHAVKQGSLRR